jgi:hypothetical protein
MSRNGSGIYNLPAGNPVVTGTTITSNWGNTTMSDIATALTGSVAADGQTPITGNIQMGSNKITGMANGTALTDAATVGQAVPTGAILMWSGSIATIPTGWLICDGTNGTPDLRSRFVVGAGSTYAVNATGGSADAILVSHNHGGSTGLQSADHSHTGTTGGMNANNPHNHAQGGRTFDDPSQPLQVQAGGSASIGNQFTASVDINHGHSFTTDGVSANHSHSITTEGSSATNANLPPYLALAYIMKA